MYFKIIFGLTVALSVTLVACTSNKTMNTSDNGFQQGISGRILWEEGNQMPSFDVDRKDAGKAPKGVKRVLYIHELTSAGLLDKNSEGFYPEIPTGLVKTVESDEDGTFKVGLPAGEYSLFVKEEGGFYANLMDGKNNVFPVKVEKGNYTEVDFIINYKAVY